MGGCCGEAAFVKDFKGITEGRSGVSPPES